MKRILLATIAALGLVSCEQKTTLQKYFVEHSEKRDYVSLDIAPNIIETDKIDLTEEEKTAMNSLEKFNVLFYKKNDKNAKQYEEEKDKVKNIIKEDDYEELIKFSSDNGGGSISTKGEGEHIDEFAVFMYNSDTGFGVVRVLGEDMTPNNVMSIVKLLEKANIDEKQLKPLQDMLKMNKK